jgi:hypothetical protein
MAKIECKIKRAGGSKIDVGGVVYHFAPTNESAEAPHVCEVKDEDHIATFLAIREGYKLVGAAEKPAEAKPSDSGTGEGEAEDDGSTMVLVNGDDRIDLMAMGKDKLLKFAAEHKFTVDKKANAQALRESIYTQAKA